MNFWDQTISFFSPKAGLKRKRARIKMKQIEKVEKLTRGYEGASKANRLTWLASDNDANSEINGAQATLRDRARDLRRNNPYAEKAVQTIVSNVIGTGIRPKFDGSSKARVKNLELAWKRWAESRQIDADNQSDIYGMQKLIMSSVVESGEIFIRRRRRKSKDGLSIPLQVQLLESDFLDRSRNQKLKGGQEIINGIQFDSNGRRVGYWMFQEHPGKSLAIGSVNSQMIPADDIIHVFRKNRPGQDFGVTWFHPVLVRFRELDIYQDATLKKQQVSALFAAFVYDSGEELENDSGLSESDELLEKLDVGTVEILPPGKDIKFANPPSSADYPNFIKNELMAISAGLGITYEALTNDYSNVNYSSGRMGWKEFSRNITDWQDSIIILGFMIPLWDWFINAYELSGGNAEKIEINFTRPAREMIDPSKEVKADQTAIESGFKTASSVIRSYGLDPMQVFQERAAEIKLMKELGITINNQQEVNNAESQDQGSNSEE